MTTAEQELEVCRDDLFRLQPVCRISDGSIIGAFESLSEQLINWIDSETPAFEKANPDAHESFLISGRQNSDVASFSQMLPSAGEFLCRHEINRYMLEHVFDSNIYPLGLSADYTGMLLTIEHGMAALKPPSGVRARLPDPLAIVLCLTTSDTQTVYIWRTETLSALAATQECTDLKEEQIIQCGPALFENLSVSFPDFFGREEVLNRIHDRVTVPAAIIVSELHGSALVYRLDIQRFTKDDLEKVIVIDVETEKTLRPGSAIVSDREAVIRGFQSNFFPRGIVGVSEFQ